ncbi:MAG: hypothetical protein HC814_06010, partial [Rhodobacteraceae bacterium]|nr:hypothetical protein [Paracoccaceae bacterium]
MQRITEGRGTHEVTMVPGNQAFVTTWSDAETPPCTYLRDLDDNQLRVIAKSRPQLLAPYGLRAPEFVKVGARDGFEMEGMLIKP